MARTNKYASLNFNDIYEKKITTNGQSSSPTSLINPNKSKTILSNSRIHGNMLVLSRPTPKPIPQPSPAPPPQAQQDQRPDPDSVSLRPLGRTGSGFSLHSSPLTSPPIVIKEGELSVSPKPGRFVPPHLRPGYLCKEEKPNPDFQKQPGARSREFGGGHCQGQFGYGEEGRPKSGGGYERMRRGGSDLVEMHRPGSSGSRPSSSG